MTLNAIRPKRYMLSTEVSNIAKYTTHAGAQLHKVHVTLYIYDVQCILCKNLVHLLY